MQALRIQLKDAGKRYLKQWLFRNINLELIAGDRMGITGLNGSGKSTLLQILAGYVSLTEGTILFSQDNQTIEHSDWYRYIAAATPYLEIPEELSLRENILFFADHKQLRYGDPLVCAEIAGLSKFMDRPVKFFSSGMKQRLRLVLALSADVPVVLLDEPVMNLDRESIGWYHCQVAGLPEATILVVCSNNSDDELLPCKRKIDLQQFKL